MWAGDVSGCTLGDLPPWLDRSELARVGRLRSPDQWAAARIVLRAVLGAHLGMAPAEVPIVAPRGAAPRVVGRCLSFSVSHARSRFLIAVTARRRIGIDVEAVADLADLADLARRLRAPGERLDDGPGPFYRSWTRKEATVKADGAGLEIPLQQFRVDRPGGAIVATPPWRRLEGLTVRDLAVWSDHAAALATDGTPPVDIVQLR